MKQGSISFCIAASFTGAYRTYIAAISVTQICNNTTMILVDQSMVSCLVILTRKELVMQARLCRDNLQVHSFHSASEKAGDRNPQSTAETRRIVSGCYVHGARRVSSMVTRQEPCAKRRRQRQESSGGESHVPLVHGTSPANKDQILEVPIN